MSNVKEFADEIIETLVNRCEDAREKDEEHVFHFFMSVAFTLGSLVHSASTPEGRGPMMMGIMEAVGKGLASAVEESGGSMTVVVGSVGSDMSNEIRG